MTIQLMKKSGGEPSDSRWGRFALASMAVIWLGALACSGWYGLRYDFSRHAVAVMPEMRRLADTGLDPSSSGMTLLYFAHPHCPCTRASVTELTNCLTVTAGKTPRRVYAIVSIPERDGDDWLETPIVQSIARAPDVEIVADRGGLIAEKLGVSTSGEVLLFDDRGALVYAGGVTGSRGHEGDNVGAERLRTLLSGSGEADGSPAIPAFGCRLCLPGEPIALSATPRRLDPAR